MPCEICELTARGKVFQRWINHLKHEVQSCRVAGFEFWWRGFVMIIWWVRSSEYGAVLSSRHKLYHTIIIGASGHAARSTTTSRTMLWPQVDSGYARCFGIFREIGPNWALSISCFIQMCSRSMTSTFVSTTPFQSQLSRCHACLARLWPKDNETACHGCNFNSFPNFVLLSYLVSYLFISLSKVSEKVWSYIPRMPPYVSGQFVIYHGYKYRTLDGTYPDVARPGFQDFYLPLLDGWMIAEWEEDVRMVAESFPWGAHRIVHSGTITVHCSCTTLYRSCECSRGSGRIYSTRVLENVTEYKCSHYDRILIRQPIDIMTPTTFTSTAQFGTQLIVDQPASRCYKNHAFSKTEQSTWSSGFACLIILLDIFSCYPSGL